MNFFFNAPGILLSPLALAPAFPCQFSKWGSNSVSEIQCLVLIYGRMRRTHPCGR